MFLSSTSINEFEDTFFKSDTKDPFPCNRYIKPSFSNSAIASVTVVLLTEYISQISFSDGILSFSFIFSLICFFKVLTN